MFRIQSASCHRVSCRLLSRLFSSVSFSQMHNVYTTSTWSIQGLYLKEIWAGEMAGEGACHHVCGSGVSSLEPTLCKKNADSGELSSYLHIHVMCAQYMHIYTCTHVHIGACAHTRVLKA